MFITTGRKKAVFIVLILLGLFLIWLGSQKVPTSKNTAGSASITGEIERVQNNEEAGSGQTEKEAGGMPPGGDDTLNGLPEKDLRKKTGEEFFVEYRLERERTRGRQLELLQQIVDNPNSAAESKQEAQDRIIEIARRMELEMQLENLIKAKGFEDTAVFIQSDSATVIVDKKELEEPDVAKIADLVSRHTGLEMAQIVIIPKG